MKREKVLPDITVLYTSAGGAGYPSHVRCFASVKERKIKVIGTAQDSTAPGFAFVDKGYVVPAVGTKEYIEEIFNICKKEGVKVVIPADPREINTFAKEKDRFEKNGIKVVVSSPKSLRTANDKCLLYEYCNRESIPAPAFFRPGDYAEFMKAVSSLGYPESDVCFKPVISSGSRGFRVITSRIDRLDLLLANQPDSTFTSIEEVNSVLGNSRTFPDLVVMEYLPGDEYSVDVVADKGKALVIVPRIREKIILGASFTGRVVKHEQIIEYSRKIVSGLGLNGAVGLQFRMDKEGIPKILEVNARPHGALTLSAAAGVNILYLATKVALGEKVTPPKIIWNTKLTRYYDEVYWDEAGHSFRI